jgi:hypothetical protein
MFTLAVVAHDPTRWDTEWDVVCETSNGERQVLATCSTNKAAVREFNRLARLMPS